MIFLVKRLILIYVCSFKEIFNGTYFPERRIEQARKSHRAQEYKKGPSLIPIQRLPIPSTKIISSRETNEQQPLVEWESDDRFVPTHFYDLSI